MKLLPSFKTNIIQNFRSNLSGMQFEGIGLTAILLIISLILVINIVRVINNGKKNYSVYLYEKNLLEDIKQTNEELSEQYAYSSSEEAQRISARDVLGLARPEENLYKTKEQNDFFKIEVKLIDLQDKKDYRNWWSRIISN